LIEITRMGSKVVLKRILSSCAQKTERAVTAAQIKDRSNKFFPVKRTAIKSSPDGGLWSQPKILKQIGKIRVHIQTSRFQRRIAGLTPSGVLV
jgi:hypothetical protein